MPEIFITQDGFEKTKRELVEFKNKRKKVAQRIARAKELGDLSENAEYQEARETQSFIEGKIIELENLIRSANVVSGKKSPNFVSLGSIIEVKLDGEIKEFIIVGPPEASPREGKISHVSPLGKAFLGKRAGDEVEISVPRGKVKYTILAIR